MKILAVIPARKNSKRIKFKNKKKLGNKPLIEYTIDVAKKIKIFKKILVTTDDAEIIKISKKKKVLAPWVRPKNLSGPNVSTYKTIRHAVEWFEKKLYKIDIIFLLQPTSPFRTKKNILDALKLLKHLKYKNSIVSVSLNKIRNKINKFVNVFELNGSIFVIKKNELYKYKTFITKKSVPLIIENEKESLDIDYINDWITAKKYVKKS